MLRSTDKIECPSAGVKMILQVTTDLCRTEFADARIIEVGIHESADKRDDTVPPVIIAVLEKNCRAAAHSNRHKAANGICRFDTEMDSAHSREKIDVEDGSNGSTGAARVLWSDHPDVTDFRAVSEPSIVAKGITEFDPGVEECCSILRMDERGESNFSQHEEQCRSTSH